MMHQRINTTDLWAILRCRGQQTLPLMRSLQVAGFEAWTPMETLAQRPPRNGKAKPPLEVPIAPTFVFVRRAHVEELLAVRAAPSSPHPDFSFFHHHGDIPFIRGSELASLRLVEGKATARRRAKERHGFKAGAEVKVDDQSAFVGLTGVVETSKGHGKRAIVTFGGSVRWNIASWLLREDALSASASQSARPTAGLPALASA